MNKMILYNLTTLLRRMFRRTKPIQVTSMAKAEWENVILKLDIEFIAVTIDCFSYRKKRKHYIENIPKVIDPQKTIFDMTNYPGYVIIYISNNDDLYTLHETYNKIYSLYGESTKIELLTGKFYKDKDGEASNVIQFSLKELPMSSMYFDQITDSI